jgi:hypothetical protein
MTTTQRNIQREGTIITILCDFCKAKAFTLDLSEGDAIITNLEYACKVCGSIGSLQGITRMLKSIAHEAQARKASEEYKEYKELEE